MQQEVVAVNKDFIKFLVESDDAYGFKILDLDTFKNDVNGDADDSEEDMDDSPKHRHAESERRKRKNLKFTKYLQYVTAAD